MRIQQLNRTTIPLGTALSGIIDLEAYTAIGIKIPAAWDAANLTFLGGETEDLAAMRSIYNDAGTEYSVSAAAGRAIAILPNNSCLLPFRFIQIRSGTVGVPVNQTADRTLLICLRNPQDGR